MSCCPENKSKQEVSCYAPNGDCVCIDKHECASNNFAARGTVGLYRNPAPELSYQALQLARTPKVHTDDGLSATATEMSRRAYAHINMPFMPR